MKVIVAGSRSITSKSVVFDAIVESDFPMTELVSGTARGVDKLGEAWAELMGIPVTPFPADWDKFGKPAGHIRNEQMAQYADCLIAVSYQNSDGTADMISLAEKYKLPVEIIRVKRMPGWLWVRI